jgi:hypothetical protein
MALTPVSGAHAKAKAAHKAPSSASQQPPRQQLPTLRPVVADYAVYVGGMHFLEAHFLFQEEHSQFRINALVQTNGFWHWLFPWEARLRSDGRIEGARFEPKEHWNTATWKNAAKTIRMHFDNRQNITTEFEPPEEPDPKREIVTDEQKRGALDPLTSILQLLGDLAVNKKCQATEPVYDGKRRFDLTSEDKSWGETDPQDYGLYNGKARICDVAFTMIAGEWKDREHSRFWQTTNGKEGHREPFRIWLATLSPELPELAVKAESPSSWGWIVVHLSGWHYATAAELESSLGLIADKK